MEVSSLSIGDWKDKGFSTPDYRVMNKDLRVILTTKDEEKAKRIAEQCGGTIHANR